MALTVQNLRAVGTGVEPASLLPGQLCFNITDKVIYVGDGSSVKTAFDGTTTPGVPGNGWYAMPMDFASLGEYYVANPEFYGDTPTDQQVLTWSTVLNHPIWTNGGAGGGNQVYVITNADVAAAPGATTSAKITAAIGVASPDEGDVTIVTGLPDDVYEGLYFFTTEWIKGAAYAYPSASEVIYDNTSHPSLTPTVQGAIDDLDDGLAATTAIANTANSTANSALSIANAALPKAGGTMTGTIVSRNIDVQGGYTLQFSGGVNGTVTGISSATSSTSTTTAASSAAVRSAYLLAQAALPYAGGVMTGTITFATGQIFPVSGIQDATTGQKGVVQVGSNIDVTAGVISIPVATTSSNGVVTVGANLNVTSGVISVPLATTSSNGVVTVGNNIDVASGVISVKTATSTDLGVVRNGTHIQNTGGVLSILDATTSQQGVVQLNNTTSSGSTTQALTAAMGQSLQTQINGITISGTVTLAGSIDANTGLVLTVTSQGALAGFAVGSPLPSPTPDPSPPGNNNYYVIVTNPGTFTPPGGSPVTSENGDWILSDGTAWQELEVGARPAYANTVTAGVVVLADDPSTQAGLDGTLAVTPQGLQSKVSDSVSTTSSNFIASSTAVKTAYDLANAAVPDSSFLASGDLLVGTGAGTYSNLPAGAADYILSSDGAGNLVWVDNSKGDVTSVTGTAPITVDNTDAQNPVVGINAASTTQAGAVQLNDTTTSTSTTEAATANAVKTVSDVANAALPLAGGTMTGAITFVAGQTFPISGIQDATTAQKGVVQIGTNIDISSGTISVKTATTGQLGLVQVGTNIDVAAGTISVKSASTTQSGIVQLNDTTTSTSTTQALTANQGYNLQQQINALSTSNNLTFAGTIDGSTGLLATVTVEGAAVGFTVGAVLPSPSATINEYFVIASVAGTMTPPGGVLTQVYVGDWWLASSTAWTYIAAGFQPPYASTTTPGLVRLSTNAETQTGTDATEAVTPASLQSKVSDSTSTTSSTAIASSTAVKSAYDLANAAVPKACYTALGALAAGTGSGTVGTLSVGTTGQFLAANTACGTGLEWCTLSLACVPCSAYTGVGAILAGTGAGTFTALPVGTNGQVLVPNSSCTAGLEWITTSALSFVGYTCTGTPFNTAFGSGAGDSITTGICNTSLGHNAGTGLTTGNCNVLIGNNAGCGMGGASCTVVIGSNAVTAAAAGFGTVAIGSNALAALTTGACNTAIGFFAGAAVNLGIGNTLLGYRAGDAIAGGSANVAIGVDAGGLINTGGNNIAIGNFSGDAITTGGNNVAIGVNSLGALSTTNNNTAVGHVSGCAVTTGSSNVLLGCGAGTGITVQDGHVAVGIQTLVGALDINNSNLVAIGTCALRSVTTGLNNIGIGFCAGTAITSGGCNIAIGAGALDSVTSTANNVGVGFSALTNITTGSENIAIGTCSGVAVTTGTDIVAIGHNAAFTQSSGAQSVHIGTCAARSANAVGVTAIGFCAGQASTTAGCITYLGWTAGRNATGLNNTYVGALTGCAASNTSACGTLLGFCAGSALTTGNGNTLLGFQAGRFVTTGGFNVALGPAALQTATTGSSNVAIGCGALAGIGTTSGNTAVGHRAGVNATGSNNVVVGCDAGNQLSTGSTNVFIGNTAGDAVTTGSNNTIIGDVAGTTGLTGEAIIAAGTTIKFQANASGAWSPDGTNYGTTGQTLQSAGTGAPPTWVTGASGTFTSQDGKTITVTNGLITSIV